VGPHDAGITGSMPDSSLFRSTTWAAAHWNPRASKPAMERTLLFPEMSASHTASWPMPRGQTTRARYDDRVGHHKPRSDREGTMGYSSYPPIHRQVL
jgi:hypothetical protein